MIKLKTFFITIQATGDDFSLIFSGAISVKANYARSSCHAAVK